MPAESVLHVQVKKRENGSVCAPTRDFGSHGPGGLQGQDEDQLLWQCQIQVRPLSVEITGEQTNTVGVWSQTDM